MVGLFSLSLDHWRPFLARFFFLSQTRLNRQPLHIFFQISNGLCTISSLHNRRTCSHLSSPSPPFCSSIPSLPAAIIRSSSAWALALTTVQNVQGLTFFPFLLLFLRSSHAFAFILASTFAFTFAPPSTLLSTLLYILSSTLSSTLSSFLLLLHTKNHKFIMSSVAQGVPFATMTNKVHVAPKRFLSTSSTSMESTLEDMLMTQTPPLDLGSDSGEDPDDEHTMDTLSYSPAPSLPSSTASPMAPRAVHKNVSFPPSYSSSTLEPISILHNSKTSRTSHTKTVAFSHPSFEPKSTGPRPAVSFDLDLHCQEEQEEQEEQDVPQQPSMADLMMASMSIESNSTSHPHHQDKGLQVSQPSLLSIQLKDQASPSQSPLSTSYSLKPLEAQGQDHSDRLSCIENHITPQSARASAQHSSWAPTATKIANDDTNKVENEPQETTNCVCVPSEMLVALIDRPSELEALAAIHSDLFNLMYGSMSPCARCAFKTLLFTPRAVLSDRDWMQAITRPEFLPCVLQKFKALVGWVDIDDANDNGRAWDDDDEDEYGYEDSLEQVEIKWFRDLDGFSVEVFEKCYPQFFVNARERLQGRRMALGGDHRDRYVVFCETLGLSRQELLCDNAWTRRMNVCLEKNPELLLQLKEIVAYEVESDD